LSPQQSSNPIEISSVTKIEEGSSSGIIRYAGDAQSIFMIRTHFENVNGQKYFVESTIRHRTLKVLRVGRFSNSTSDDLIKIAEDEEPYLTDKGRKEAQNWIQLSYTYLP
jgi:hypothetical protein